MNEKILPLYKFILSPDGLKVVQGKKISNLLPEMKLSKVSTHPVGRLRRSGSFPGCRIDVRPRSRPWLADLEEMREWKTPFRIALKLFKMII